MVRHLDQRLHLKDVAAVAGMETHAFGRFFRQATGTTFRRWLIERRLTRAQELLRRRNHSIGQVAAAVGFGTERTFRQRFRERFGCTPSQFRSRARARRRRRGR
ncbi:MAG: helix-turn-helix transcriptional regulator [Acidobacteria bacterium]|nr:helix-turn-helix transcriptional regulator [Acidobacteriota bacterium]